MSCARFVSDFRETLISPQIIIGSHKSTTNCCHQEQKKMPLFFRHGCSDVVFGENNVRTVKHEKRLSGEAIKTDTGIYYK